MASCLSHCANYFLVYFIGAIVLWSYYAFVVEMCIIWCDNVVQKIFYIIIYHLILVMFVYCYFRAVTAGRKSMPVEFYLNSEEHEKALDLFSNRPEFSKYLEELITKKKLPIKTRDVASSVRFCGICQLIKPDRTHHCSMCNTCLLRMDHHCPWVGSCVAFHNHKFFIQFLSYGSLYCLFVAATALEFAMGWWTKGMASNMRGINFLLLVVIGSMFCLVQASLAGYHVYLTMNNLTTLESMRKSVFLDTDVDSFDLGKAANLREMFGNTLYDCFFPSNSTQGDGVDYPIKRKLSDYRSLEER